MLYITSYFEVVHFIMDFEYPDPEDEYEMRFADELEMMDELGLFYSHIIFYLNTYSTK